MFHGTVVVEGAEETEPVGGVAAEATGAAAVGYGEAFVIGTPAQELMPGLPISVESSGIPACAVEAADEDGADDEATLSEPEPHIPNDPAVAELVDNPEVADAPDVAPVPGVGVATMDAVAGGAVPFRPPPS